MNRAGWAVAVVTGILPWTGCSALPDPPWVKPATGGWEVLRQGPELGGAILAAWQAGPDRVFFVGGSVGNGLPALAWSWDGSALTQLQPGGTDTYWWMHGSSANDAWLVGEHGRITRFDGTTFTEQPRVVDTTLWGVIAFSSTDAWAVGGMPGRPSADPDDVVLHWDGSAWTQEALPGTPRNVALLKVWGTSADNLFVVGERGTIWHRTGAGWHLQTDDTSPPLAQGTLFTVHGCSGTEIYAAGGPTLLRYDGAAWSRVEVSGLSTANGVACAGGELAVVGFGGLKMRIVGGNVTNDADQPPFTDLHGALQDSNGNLWVVGGDWSSQAEAGVAREGAIARWIRPSAGR